MLLYAASAPFHNSESFALKSGQNLLLYFRILIERLIDHKDPEDAVRFRRNAQHRRVCIFFILKSYEVIRILQHPGQPVHDEFIVFLSGKSQGSKLLLQESSRIFALDDKTLAEIILRVGNALPNKDTSIPCRQSGWSGCRPGQQ